MSAQQISSSAVATREQSRDPSGKFGTQPATESEVILAEYPMEPHDTIAAPIDELRSIDADEQELFEAGIKSDSRAVRALADQRKQILGNMLVDAEHVELDDHRVAGKVIAYAKDGTVIFTDGTYSRADGPILPCGHDQRTPGCGGCDPGAVESVIEDGSATVRPYDAQRDLAYTPPDAVLNAAHPAIQAGEVRDRVRHSDYGVFHRRREGVFPVEPYAMRFQSHRQLGEEEKHKAAAIIGYAYRARVAGEPMGKPVRDSAYSFVISADTTKSPRSDPDQALLDFEEDTKEMLSQGTPKRKTSREGPYSMGSRLVSGFGADAPRFELYYDSVAEARYEDEDDRSGNERKIEGQGR